MYLFSIFPSFSVFAHSFASDKHLKILNLHCHNFAICNLHAVYMWVFFLFLVLNFFSYGLGWFEYDFCIYSLIKLIYFPCACLWHNKLLPRECWIKMSSLFVIIFDFVLSRQVLNGICCTTSRLTFKAFAYIDREGSRKRLVLA